MSAIDGPEPTLSPAAALVVAGGLVLLGVAAIAAAVGVIPLPGGLPNAPPWVIICVGLVCIEAASAVILGFAIVPPSKDGRPPERPPQLRLMLGVIGMTIAGLTLAVVGWFAFGR